MELKASTYSACAWGRIAPVWREVYESSPGLSFFVSPDWTGAWMEVFGRILLPEILVFEDAGAPVGICLLVKQYERQGPFRIHRVYLNAAGEDELDETELEFNDLVCRPGYEEKMARAIRVHLKGERWDELAFNGVPEGPGLLAMHKEFGDACLQISRREAPYVNLAKLRERCVRYEDCLGTSVRRSYRQSSRMYSPSGAYRVYTAAAADDALAMLDELAGLHQRTWVSRGKPGAFASTKFYDFHRALIRLAFPAGMIQLARVTAGADVVGLLYNFVHNNRVYFYQSGLHYVDDNRFRPGLVTFFQMIQHCLERGFDEFNFLAGGAEYKSRLATDSRQLAWLDCRKVGLKMRGIDLLRRSKRSIMNRIGKSTEPGKVNMPAIVANQMQTEKL
jgi:hypothetical protein